MVNSSCSNNNSTTHGGCISTLDNSVLNLDTVNITNNKALSNGGALYLLENSTAQLFRVIYE